MMKFSGIEPQNTPYYISEAWELLEPAAERNGDYTQESARAALLTGEFQLWCVFSEERMIAACITETARYPGGQRCSVVLCGGEDMKSWLTPCLSVIEAWAREVGCQRMRIEGRAGWERALPDYDKRNVVLVKELDHA